MARFVPNDCTYCNEPAPITQLTGMTHIFLLDAECNHVRNTCQGCGETETIYYRPTQILQVIQALELPVTFYPEAPDELKARAKAAWDAYENGDSDDVQRQEPQVVPGPRTEDDVERLVRQLQDDLLDWDAGGE